MPKPMTEAPWYEVRKAAPIPNLVQKATLGEVRVLSSRATRVAARERRDPTRNATAQDRPSSVRNQIRRKETRIIMRQNRYSSLINWKAAYLL